MRLYKYLLGLIPPYFSQPSYKPNSDQSSNLLCLCIWYSPELLKHSALFCIRQFPKHPSIAMPDEAILAF